MPKPRPVYAYFPTGGMVRRFDLQHQPPYTTPWCQNVRPRDLFLSQERGGSRPGLGPAFYEQLGSGAPINFLQAIELREDIPRQQWPESFQAGNLGTDWVQMTGLYGQNGRPRINGIRNFAYAQYGDGLLAAGHQTFTNIDHSGVEEVSLFIFPHKSFWWGTYYLYFYLDETTPGADTNTDGYPDDGITATLFLEGQTGEFTCNVRSYTGGSLNYSNNGSGDTGYVQAGWFSLRVTSAQMELYWLGNKVANISHGIPSPVGYGFGFGIKPGLTTWTSTVWSAESYCVPTTPNGYYYYTESGGASGGTEPTTWGTTIGGPTTDGAVTWICTGKTTGARAQADLFRYQYDPLSPTAESRTRLVIGSAGKLYVEADEFRKVGASSAAGALEVSSSCTIKSDRLIHGASIYQQLFIADHGENKVKVTDAEITGKDGRLICSPTVLNFGGQSGFTTWTGPTPVALGEYWVPTVANGFIYRCIAAGTTGGTEPVWPKTDSETKVDGTVQWITCLARNVSTADDLLTIYGAEDGSESILGQYEIHYVQTEYAAVWTGSTVMSVYDRRRPTAGGFYEFEVVSVTGGAQTGAGEPAWVYTVGSDTTDNEVTWRCIRSTFILINPALTDSYKGEKISIQIERCPKVLDFVPEVTAAVRQDSTAYKKFQIVRPLFANGRVYECETEGTSDSSEPDMDVAVGATVTDGGVTWRCRKYLLRKYLATRGATPLGCPLITRYRGRILLIGNPGNVGYASRLGNAFDWFFGDPIYDPSRATQLWPGEAGEIPDQITAAAPASDDYLVIGTADTLWRLAGDPASGGQLQNLSRKIGILSPTSWCFGPGGEIVFLSRAGIKMVPPGGAGYPQDLSELKLPDELKNIDPSYFDVLMGYDPPDGVVHNYLSGRQPRATRHYTLDWLGNSMWPVDLHGLIYPRILCTYTTGDAGWSGVVHGCYDGKLRWYRRTYENDEGNTLSEFVYYGPFSLGGKPDWEGKVKLITAMLDEESGPITWTLYIAPTPQETINSAIFAGATPLPAGYRQFTGTWQPGPNYPRTPELSGCYAALALTGYRLPTAGYENSRAWAIQEIMMIVEPLDRRRIP